MAEDKLWTVGELIARLSEFLPDTPVLYEDSRHPGFCSRLDPETEEIIENNSGKYYSPQSFWGPEKQRFEAVILNHLKRTGL